MHYKKVKVYIPHFTPDGMRHWNILTLTDIKRQFLKTGLHAYIKETYGVSLTWKQIQETCLIITDKDKIKEPSQSETQKALDELCVRLSDETEN